MPHTLLPRYPNAGFRYDEMLDGNGQVRPHWLPLLSQLAGEAREAPQTMAQRLQTVQRQVRENGVTYNVYADPRGSQRPWNLDVLPLILPDDEWQQIEQAVIQRASLLNRVMQDIYGNQHMLSEGLLPSALVYGNGGFLRPCHAIVPPGEVALHTYAADLVRDSDGRWRVVNDRTQSPSGAAYALENRQIISRAFPELFRELKIADLDGFFATLRDSLDYWGRAATALAQSEQPLMVLLTPGPYNETYYEQSYLARFLGFPLVEGSDLTVRNGKVWMKTLSGLQRVHVILRRLDDDYCDPLELRPDSSIGVVGLTEAARRGNVLIANSLGSNVLESGALFEFFPQLCQRLLGQELLMPSVESLWCGRPQALETAIARLEHMVIKPSFPQLRVAPLFGSDLSPEQRAALIDKMRERPQNHVAQSVLHLSHTPIWQAGHGLGAAGVGLRVFACATPNGYQVMPGGLARIASAHDTRVINMQHGAASKDVWVSARGKTVSRHLLHHATTSADLSRGDTHLSSRVVDNFFWFGRYAERCENIVRLTRTALEMRLHASTDQRGEEWRCVMELCQSYNLLGNSQVARAAADAGGQNSGPTAGLSDEQIEQALIQSVVKANVPGLASYLQDLFGVAFHLRERLSLDNWRKLNQMIQQIESAVQKPLLADALILLDDATTSLMTITGFALDGMTRDLGWRFLSIGRWIERMQFLCRNLQCALSMPPDSQLEWLLELADSIVTYRSRYMAKPEWLPVLDLLLLDETNPRSIIFQLKGLKKYLNHLPDTQVQALLGPTLKALRALQPQTDLQRDSRALTALLDQTRQASYAISERIEIRFFSNTDQLLQHDAPPAEYGDLNYGAGTP